MTKRPLFIVLRANREKAQQRASSRRHQDELEKALATMPKGFAWFVLGPWWLFSLIFGKEKK